MADITINYGPITQIISANYEKKVVSLSDTTFVVGYAYGSEPSYVYARVGTISGTTITMGTAVQMLQNSATDYTSGNWDICAVSSTKFVVAGISYDFDVGRWTELKACTVSGTSITQGSLNQYDLYEQGQRIRIVAMTDSTVMIISHMRRNSQDDTGFMVQAADVTNIYSITRGGYVYSYISGGSNTVEVSLAKLTSTLAFAVVQISSSYQLIAIRITLSGTTVTIVNSTVISAGSYYIQNPELFPISTTQVLLSWYPTNGSTARKIKLLTDNGSSVGFGADFTFTNAGSTYPIGFTMLTTDKGLVSYNNGSGYGTTAVLTIAGTTISVGDGTVFNAIVASYPNLNLLSSSENSGVILNTYNIYGHVASYNLISGKKINGITYAKWNGTAITKWANQ